MGGGGDMVWIYADEHIVVIDKPAGMLAVPGRGPDKADCAAARVRQRFADALVVHRLDMATSGLMAFARGHALQRELNHRFATRQVLKTYVAVVAGLPDRVRGEIELPLAADWPNRPRQAVDHARGRPATTCWLLLARDVTGNRARLLLQPLSGRTHQLRVHLAAIGHPIVGDALYAPPAAQAAAPRLLLHARALALGPIGSETPDVNFLSPVPF